MWRSAPSRWKAGAPPASRLNLVDPGTGAENDFVSSVHFSFLLQQHMDVLLSALRLKQRNGSEMVSVRLEALHNTQDSTCCGILSSRPCTYLLCRVKKNISSVSFRNFNMSPCDIINWVNNENILVEINTMCLLAWPLCLMPLLLTHF